MSASFVARALRCSRPLWPLHCSRPSRHAFISFSRALQNRFLRLVFGVRFFWVAVFLVALGSCRRGDLGPLSLPLVARSDFAVSSTARSGLGMSRGQMASASFFLDGKRRWLRLGLGREHIIFQNVRFNVDAGILIASPAESKVFDRRGLRVGVQLTRRYLGGNSAVSQWDYRAQIFTERNEVLAAGTASIKAPPEHHR